MTPNSQPPITGLLRTAFLGLFKRIWVFLTVSVGFAGVLWAAQQLQRLLGNFLEQLVAEGAIPPRFIASMGQAHAMIPWLLLAPVIVALCTFNARVFFLHDGKAPLIASLRAFVHALRNSIRSLVYATWYLFYYSIPAIAVILLSAIVEKHALLQGLQLGYFILAAIVMVWTAHRCIPVLVAPVLCAASDINPYYQVSFGQRFYREARPQIILIMVLMVVPILVLRDLPTSTSTHAVAVAAAILATLYLGINMIAHLAVIFLARDAVARGGNSH